MKNILFTLNGIWIALFGIALWFHFEGEFWTGIIVSFGLILGFLWGLYLNAISDC